MQWADATDEEVDSDASSEPWDPYQDPILGHPANRCYLKPRGFYLAAAAKRKSERAVRRARKQCRDPESSGPEKAYTLEW